MSRENEETERVESSAAGEVAQPLPFVALCNDLAISAPFGWLKGGWHGCRDALNVTQWLTLPRTE